MPEVEGINKLLSIVPRKRFGRFTLYGSSMYGFSVYGESDLFLPISDYGYSVFGYNKYGDIILLSGIYRTDNVTGKTKCYREPYYIPKNPRSEAQQAQRQKYANGVVAWQALTEEEKEIYNKRAKHKKYSGYHLFLKEYLLSN